MMCSTHISFLFSSIVSGGKAHSARIFTLVCFKTGYLSPEQDKFLPLSTSSIFFLQNLL